MCQTWQLPSEMLFESCLAFPCEPPCLSPWNKYKNHLHSRQPTLLFPSGASFPDHTSSYMRRVTSPPGDHSTLPVLGDLPDAASPCQSLYYCCDDAIADGTQQTMRGGSTRALSALTRCDLWDFAAMPPMSRVAMTPKYPQHPQYHTSFAISLAPSDILPLSRQI